jgi:phage tail tube protein FII
LNDLSGREGLSGYEFNKKMEALRESMEDLPDLKQHLSKYRGTVAGAMAAAATDSGSEDLYTSRRSRGSSVSLSLTHNVQQKREEFRKSIESGDSRGTVPTSTAG